MNAKEFDLLLRWLGACSEGREWCKGKSLAEVWQTSDRADWMIWLCAWLAGTPGWPTRQDIVLVACLCAERSLKHFEAKYPTDDRPRKAIAVARAWAKNAGDDAVSLEEVRKARRAAADAADAADADYAAAAAAAAAYAAYAAAYAAASASAAADACSAFGQARDAEMKAICEIVRANLAIPCEQESAA